ncbi:MAG: DUF4198 domain-containing protein [Steroidobacteraceae bacterium]
MHIRPFASLALVAALSALVASTAQAHGIWFAQRATQTALIYGVGADDLDMVKRQPLVTRIDGYDEDLQPVPTELRADGPLLLVESDLAPPVVAAVMFNGIWSKKPDGQWVKKGRDEVPDATISEKNYKYAVFLRGEINGALQPLPGQRLQILPVPATLPALLDEPLQLRVLFDGKPMAGVRILRDYVNDPDAEPLKTAADGTVTIKVRNQGLNVVAAIYDGPSDEPTKADKMEHLATLAFVLPHKPE